MNRNESYLYQLRAHMMYHFLTEVYIDESMQEYEAFVEANPELAPIVKLFEDIDARESYARPFRQVMNVYLETELPELPEFDHNPFLGAIVYINRYGDDGIGMIEGSDDALWKDGELRGYSNRATRFTPCPPDVIDRFFITLRLNCEIHHLNGDVTFDNCDTRLTFDWRKGMTGAGRFKKEWAESAIASFFSGNLSPTVVDGLTPKHLYDILEESADTSLACRLLMEVLLEQITE